MVDLVRPCNVRLLLVAAGFLTMTTAPMSSQSARAEGPVTYGHHHLNVSSVADHQKFWVTTLGGKPVTIGATDNVLFPGLLIRLRAQQPNGTMRGSAVSQIGIQVSNLALVIQRASVAGYRTIVDSASTPSSVLVIGPDEVSVVLFDERTSPASFPVHRVLFEATDPWAMKAWYERVFGAAAELRSAELPGMSLRWTAAATPPVRTLGRVLDHIGFEVEGLEAFCKKLEASGIKLDRPFTKVPELGIANAFLSDPAGTYIELTEGLRRLVE